RIRKVSGGIINAIAGTGSPGFSGDGGPALNASLSGIQGVAVDSAGNVYIADAGNARVRVATPTGTINSISPAFTFVGTLSFTLTVNGAGFTNGNTVQWNGAALTTTFVSSSQLTASVAASRLTSTGTVSINVLTSSGTTNSVSFNILPL